MSEKSGDTSTLIESVAVGGAVLAAQRVEFLLYGLIAHTKDEIKNDDKRFQGLTPETFLRGDLADLRVTLGQLVEAFGGKFLLSTKELKKFVKDRNLIVHNYWRRARSDIAGGEPLEDPVGFVLLFLQQCERWEKILKGLLAYMRLYIARKRGDEQKAGITEEDQRYMEYYAAHVEEHGARPGVHQAPIGALRHAPSPSARPDRPPRASAGRSAACYAPPRSVWQIDQVGARRELVGTSGTTSGMRLASES